MAIKILILVALLALVFGKGKFSDLMGDVAKGIKSFRKGMAEDDEDVVTMKPAPALDAPSQVPVADAVRKEV